MNSRDKAVKARPRVISSNAQNNRSQQSTSTQAVSKTSGSITADKVSNKRNQKTGSKFAANRLGNKFKADRNLKKSYFDSREVVGEHLNEMSTPLFPVKEVERPIDGSVEQETDFDDREYSKHDEDDEDADESRGLLNVSSASDSSSKTINSKGPFFRNDTRSKNDYVTERSSLPRGWEQHSDKVGLYYWHVSTGIIQRNRPTEELSPRKDCIAVYHDDEEINQAQKTSSDDDEYYESGAALTAADDTVNESTFVVHLLGCCEFDETQLVSATSTKAIQKCILRLSNKPTEQESVCWGIDQSRPVLMRLFDDHIQFTDINSRTLLRSQPIQKIKTWAVDDDNNFAFVVEERAQQSPSSNNLADYALFNEPSLMCYVFRSMDDDDMSCKVAAKLNEGINRYKEQISNQISKSTRLQQMVEPQPLEDQTDIEDFDDMVASNELTMNVKYIGKTPVPRPTGIDVLNIAIDKCLAEASDIHISRKSMVDDSIEVSPLTEAKLHVSPSSVIVENVITGEIIVECRIRYLTFMGISKRDIRWCGFIMQNANNKTFIAHCFECHPTAGHVCDAIQSSCTKMYEKVLKNSRRPPETISIIPTSSKIRNTLAKTFSRIKLNPIS